MKTRSKIFSTPEVQAIIDDRKTMFRVPVKPQPEDGLWNDDKYPRSLDSALKGWNGVVADTGESRQFKCPYGEVGDVIYVRETWLKRIPRGDFGKFGYKANLKHAHIMIKWESAATMPREAARIWLQIIDIKVERLQEISEADAVAEGVERTIIIPIDGVEVQHYKNYASGLAASGMHQSAKGSFLSLLESIHGPEIIKANPWLWAISFKVLSTTGKPENIKL